MRDFHITQETYDALDQWKKGLERTIADAQFELTQIKRAQDSLRWLAKRFSPDTAPLSAPRVLVAVMERTPERVWTKESLKEELSKGEFVPVEKWGQNYKQMYTTLGRLEAQGEIVKSGETYRLVDSSEEPADPPSTDPALPMHPTP